MWVMPLTIRRTAWEQAVSELLFNARKNAQGKNGQGKAEASIASAGTIKDVTRRRIPRLAEAVKQAARDLTGRLSSAISTVSQCCCCAYCAERRVAVIFGILGS